MIFARTLPKVFVTLLSLIAGTLLAITGISPAQAATSTVGLKPNYLTVDSAGNVYSANSGDGTISKISPTGEVTLLADLSPKKPRVLAFDSAGLLYAATSTGNIYKVASDGTFTSFAKVGNSPSALVFDATGNLYSANYFDNTVSKVTAAGAVSLFAVVGSRPSGMIIDSGGNLFTANYLEGTVSKITKTGVVSVLATMEIGPAALAFDNSGNILVANSDDNNIYKVTAAGAVSTLAKVGRSPKAIAVDSDGLIYTANYLDGTISKITAAGQVSTFAVTGNGPTHFLFNSSKTLYVSNFLDNTVTVVKTSTAKPAAPKTPTTSNPASTTVDLTWAAPDAGYGAEPTSFLIEATTASGTQLVSTTKTGSSNNTFKLTGLCSNRAYQLKVYGIGAEGIGAASAATTITLPNGVPGAPASLMPIAITGTSVELFWEIPDCNGGANITDYRIGYSSDSGANWTLVPHAASVETSITATGLVLGRNYLIRVAAVNSFGIGVYSEPISVSTANPTASYTVGTQPNVMALDAAGNLYVANTGDSTVSKITTGGVVSVFTTVGSRPSAMAFDAAGNLYVASLEESTITKVTPGGVVTMFAVVGEAPTAIAFDKSGNLYTADGAAGTVTKVTPAGVVSVFASFDAAPTDLAIDSTGNIYTANPTDFTIQKTTPAGVTSTHAKLTIAANRVVVDANDNLYAFSTADSSIMKITSAAVISTLATFAGTINDLVLDKRQNLYVANQSEGTITKISSTGTISVIAVVDFTLNKLVADSNNNLFASFAENQVTKIAMGGVATAPKTVAVSTKTSSSFTLTWSAPDSDGGSALTDYKVEYSADSGTTWTTIVRSPTTTTGYTITGLLPGKAYQARVYAINGLGSSVASATVSTTTSTTIPGKTKNLTSGSATANSVPLSWEAPDSDGGSAITDYKVEYSLDGITWTSVSRAASNATSYTVSSLQPGKAYQFRVTAQNSVGLGTKSDTVTATTSTTLPGAPRSGSTSSITSSSLTLSWTAPESDGGAAISDYRIEYSSDLGSTWIQIQRPTSTATTYSFTGLLPGKAYRFRVAATNSVGTGATTSVISATTLTTLPSKPKNLTFSELTFNSVLLTWDAPDSDGGANITDYKVEYSLDGSTWSTVTKSSSTSTNYTITSLLPGRAYSFRVSALNSVGYSLKSDTAVSTTLTTIPGAPKTLTTSAVTSSSMSLAWLAPDSDGGSSITGYLIEISEDLGASWSSLGEVAGNTRTFQLQNLSPAKRYQFKVTAENINGNGSSSTVLSATTLAALASNPRNLTSETLSFSSLLLNWDIPETDGGAAITDYRIEISSNAGSTWTTITRSASTATTYTVLNLLPGKTYSFRVAALNSVGLSLKGEAAIATTLTTTASAPKTLYSSEVTPISLTLGWLAPESNGGSAITGYNVQISSDLGATWTLLTGTPVTALTLPVASLEAAKRYQFKVTALNENGLGAASTVFSVTTLSLKVPLAPASVRVSNLKSTSVSISWAAVSMTPKVTNYLVDISNDGIIWSVVAKKVSTTPSVALSGLKPGAKYWFRVAAVNIDGKGEFEYGDFTTLATVSLPVTNLRTSQITSNSFTLSWTKPSFDGGSPITDYIIEINGGGLIWAPVEHEPTTTTSITITGLKVVTKYTVRVKAVNAVGISKVSSNSAATTLATVPHAPTGLKVKSLTTTALVLTWTAPGNGGSAITSYLVEYSLDQGITWKTFTNSTVTTPTITLKGLKAKTGYLFRISAKNGVGYSVPGSFFSVVTP